MKLRLIRAARIRHEAGEIVEVSPERLAHLVSIEAAEPVKEAREQAEKPEPNVLKKKTAKKK